MVYMLRVGKQMIVLGLEIASILSFLYFICSELIISYMGM